MGHNHSEEVEIGERIAEGLILSLICVVALCGNITLWLAVCLTRDLRTASNSLILCLSTADLLVSVVNMPVTAYTIFVGNWMFSHDVCAIIGFINMLTFIASVMSLAAISLNRYVAICKTSKFTRIYTRRNTAFVIAGVWTLSLILSSPPLLGWAEYDYIESQSFCFCNWKTSVSFTFFMVFVCFGGPCFAMTFSYVNIIRNVKKSRRKLSRHSKTSLRNNRPRDSSNMASYEAQVGRIGNDSSKESIEIVNSKSKSNVLQKINCCHGPVDDVSAADLQKTETCIDATAVGEESVKSPGKPAYINNNLSTSIFKNTTKTTSDHNHLNLSDIVLASDTLERTTVKDSQTVLSKQPTYKYAVLDKNCVGTDIHSDGEIPESSEGYVECRDEANDAHTSGISTCSESEQPTRLNQKTTRDSFLKPSLKLPGERQNSNVSQNSQTKDGIPSGRLQSRLARFRERRTVSIDGSDLRPEGSLRTCDRKAARFRKNELRLTAALLVVIIVFIIAWLPFCVTMFLMVFSPSPIPRPIDMTTLLLGYFNSCCNPVIYGFMNKRFKNGYIRLFKCRCVRASSASTNSGIGSSSS